MRISLLLKIVPNKEYNEVYLQMVTNIILFLRLFAYKTSSWRMLR